MMERAKQEEKKSQVSSMICVLGILNTSFLVKNVSETMVIMITYFKFYLEVRHMWLQLQTFMNIIYNETVLVFGIFIPSFLGSANL